MVPGRISVEEGLGGCAEPDRPVPVCGVLVVSGRDSAAPVSLFGTVQSTGRLTTFNTWHVSVRFTPGMMATLSIKKDRR